MSLFPFFPTYLLCVVQPPVVKISTISTPPLNRSWFSSQEDVLGASQQAWLAIVFLGSTYHVFQVVKDTHFLLHDGGKQHIPMVK